MHGKLILLHNSIRRDMETIAAIYTELARHPLTTETDNDVLIVIAYHLHNLYNAFENIFQNIAAAFENSIDYEDHWHAQLLEHMRLDAQPLRPAVIDDDACVALDELRRFRHLFRHAYMVNIDARRLQLVWDQAFDLQKIYAEQMTRFTEFVQKLLEATS